MSIYQNLKMAEEMGVDRSFAITRRSQFLTCALIDLEGDITAALVGIDDAFTSLGLYMAISDAEKLYAKRTEIEKELEAIKRMTKNPKEQITDEMVERARAYPIDRLIEFRHKKALAWCHEDRRPSLCHMDKTNRAWCPVCDRYFDGIAVMMERGYSFKESVIALN